MYSDDKEFIDIRFHRFGGTQSLDVARLRGYNVEALTAYSDVAHMEAQIREFHPKTVAMVEEKAAADLKSAWRTQTQRCFPAKTASALVRGQTARTPCSIRL